jgi:hypothetical protein
MQTYANRGGDSNVEAFEIGADYIIVRFKDGSEYVYTYESAGKDLIEKMKELALDGHGLNSYIGRVVKKKYAYKR